MKAVEKLQTEINKILFKEIDNLELKRLLNKNFIEKTSIDIDDIIAKSKRTMEQLIKYKRRNIKCINGVKYKKCIKCNEWKIIEGNFKKKGKYKDGDIKYKAECNKCRYGDKLEKEGE